MKLITTTPTYIVVTLTTPTHDFSLKLQRMIIVSFPGLLSGYNLWRQKREESFFLFYLQNWHCTESESLEGPREKAWLVKEGTLHIVRLLSIFFVHFVIEA